MVDGVPYNVSQDREEEFLNKFPQAVLQSDEPGKSQGTSLSQQNKSKNMELSSIGGSSVSLLNLESSYNNVNKLFEAVDNSTYGYALDDIEAEIKLIQSKDFNTDRDIIEANRQLEILQERYEDTYIKYSDEINNYDAARINHNKLVSSYNKDNKDTISSLPKPKNIFDYFKNKGLKFLSGSVDIVNNVIKSYEQGKEGNPYDLIIDGAISPNLVSFITTTALKNPKVKEKLANVGIDVPEVGFFGLDTKTQRREKFESFMIEAKDKGLTLEEAQMLDPTNRIKLEKTLKWFKDNTYSYYDEEGNTLDYMDLFSRGEYGKGVDAFLDDLAGAIPSLFISKLPYGSGAALMGVGTYTSEFERELFERGNTVKRDQIVKDALISGSADFVTELIGGRILNKMVFKGMTKGVAKKALPKIMRFYAKRFLGGFVSEGATEGFAGAISELSDKWSYGDKVEFKQVLRSFTKDFFIGGFLGGPATLMSSPSKSDIYEFVASNQYKQDQMSIERKIITLTNEKKNLTGKALKQKENEIKRLKKQKDLNKKKNFDFFDTMTQTQKEKYADIFDAKNKQLDILFDERHNKQTRDEARKEYDLLNKKMSSIFNAANINYDPATEKILGKTMAAYEAIYKQKKFFGFNKSNFKVEVLSSEADIQAAIKKYGKDFKASDGIFYAGKKGGKNTIVINLPVAGVTGQTNVLGHEYFHALISNSFSEGVGKENLKSSVKSFREYLLSLPNGDGKYILERIEKRLALKYGGLNKDGSIRRDQYGLVKTKRLADQEEYFTLFSDVIKNEKIQAVEDRSAGIKKSFRALARGFGFNEVDFQSGKEVFDFLVDYQKNMNRASLLGQLTGRGLAKVKMKGLEPKKGKRGKTLKSDTIKGSVKESKSAKPAIDEIGNLGWTKKTWKEGGANFAMKEIQEMKLIDRLIASKLKVPMGVNQTEEFVAKVYSELTSHIKRFNPEINDSLFGWINSQIENKAGNVYNREYKVTQRTQDIDARTSEGSFVIQVEADTQAEQDFIDQIGLTEEQTQKYSKLRQDIKLNKQIMDKVRNAVIKTFGTKLPDVNSKKFKDELQKRFRTELKKTIQDLIGSRENYDNFLQNNFEAVYDALPVETLVQMERSVKPDQRIFTKSERITKPSEVDKLISQNRLPKDVNRLAGPQLHTKRKYPGTDKVMAFFRGVNMENQLGYKVGGSTLGTRKDKLAMEMGVELAFDATMETVQQPEVQEKRKGILSLQGMEQVENELAIIAKQIDRNPLVKFSSSGIKKGSEFYNDAYDLAIQIAANGGLDGSVEATQKGRKLRYKGVGNFKNVPESTLKYVVEEMYNKNKIFLHQGELFKKISKGIRAGDARSKGFEQFIINRFGKIDGVELRFEVQSEQGVDIPDVYGAFYGKDFNVEVKMFDAQISSLTINDIDISKGKFTVKKMKNLSTKNQIKMQELLAQMLPPFRDIQKRLKQLASDPRANAQDKTYLKNYNSPKDRMPEWAHATLKKEGYFKRLTQSALFDQTIVEDLYLNKAVPTNYIYMLGKGFFNIKTDVLGMNSPKLEGSFLVPIRQVKASQYKSVDGVRTKTGYVNLNIRALPVVNKITSKSNMDVLDGNDVNNFVSQDVRNRLKASKSVKNANNLKTAHDNIIKYSKSEKSKGMSTFDFDETVGVSDNFVIATKDGETLRIASNEWPLVGEKLADEGWQFDFSDFNKVTKGKPGPLFQKMKNQIAKYGSKNVFILTARASQSEKAIHDWLASNGINIPRENVTGLGNSTGEAKADWMLEKFAEGYNDMYFVDDALPNVKAVKDVLDQLDIKSKVVQAKVKFSKSVGKEFNKMLERTKGMKFDKIISRSAARKIGATKGNFEFFIPPSAEDFKGLIYRFLGKGKQGEQDLKWFKKNLFDPFAKAIRAHDTYKQNMSNEYMDLKNKFKKSGKSLNDTAGDSIYTNDTAIRVYLWDKAGFDVPGLSQQEKQELLDHINSDTDLKNFAEQLSVISRRKDGYIQPTENWIVESIATDLNNITNKVGRREFLSEWIENKDLVFSPENLNKIEFTYGTSVRKALEGMLYRMEFGTNRVTGSDANVNGFLDWINGSVGAVMFFNMRSALLQTISAVNFINISDNNPFKAAAAFANQQQYWTDFVTLFNSDMLKQRRAGLAIDVSASELTKAFAEGGNTTLQKTRAVIRYMLQKGFLPTQIADSFAIASGGATFYRNRIDRYVKEGMSQKEAQNQAFLDFQEVAEETQQSSRPDLISEQQAGVLGRLILAWQNTPMQMTRLTKKAISDLVNGRGNVKGNISKILYYGFVQNIIFGVLQSGLAFLMFGDDEEEEKTKLKKQRVLNGALDTLLRGTGIYGAMASTLKNTILKWVEQKDKGFGKRDDAKILMEAVNLSPPIGSKLRKINSALKTQQYNKGVGEKLGFRIENPNLSIAVNLTEALTNIPVARLVNKANNLEEAITGNHETWQRVALGLGWNRWDVNVEDEELAKAKAEAKQDRKDKKDQDKKDKKEKSKGKQVRCSATKSDGKRCKMMVTTKARVALCFYHK